MDNLIFSQFSLNELKTELTKDLTNEFRQLMLDHFTPKEADELCTKKDLSKLFGVSVVTINDWERKGKIKGYQIGTRVRFKRTEVLEALKERRVA